MKVVIVGNGWPAPWPPRPCASSTGRRDRDLRGRAIPLLSAPNLIEYLAGRLPSATLFAFPEGWSERQRIGVRSWREGHRDPAGGAEDRDRLGFRALLRRSPARDRRPGRRHRRDREGRRLRAEDARRRRRLIEHLGDHQRVAVLGGGLLGLEIARAIRSRGAEVTSSSSSTGSCPASSTPRPRPFSRPSSNARHLRPAGRGLKEILGVGGVRPAVRVRRGRRGYRHRRRGRRA